MGWATRLLDLRRRKIVRSVAYRFADHVRYLDAFLAEAGISSAYVVAQDWGTALAFQLAARRPEFVRGLSFMEFIRPMPSWDDFPARETFQNFRTSGVGEKMILEGNVFVEQILPGATIRKLTDEEMAVYRAFKRWAVALGDSPVGRDSSAAVSSVERRRR